MMLINTILGLLPEIKGDMMISNLIVLKSMDKVFYVVFAKPPDKDTAKENETKDVNT